MRMIRCIRDECNKAKQQEFFLSCAKVPSVDGSLWDDATPCKGKIASEYIHSCKIMIF